MEYMEYMKMGTQLAFLFVVACFFCPFGSQEDTACAFFLWYPLLQLCFCLGMTDLEEYRSNNVSEAVERVLLLKNKN